MKFNDLLGKVKSSAPTTLIIKDKARKIIFCASYYTTHCPDEEYLKVFLDDGTILEVIPNGEVVYFCDDERREISRDLISDDGETLRVDGKEYLLENGNDEQFVKEIYCGKVEDGEGGCVFSDYVWQDEVWSLAVLDNGEISDVHVKKITVEQLSDS